VKIELETKFNGPVMIRNMRQELMKAVQKQMEFAKGEIKERTAEGKDVNGRQFAKYNPAYAAKKGSDFVDLRVKGHMMGSIQVNVKDNGGEIVAELAVTGTENLKKAKAIMTGGDGRWKAGPRKFFALSKKQISEIKKEIKEAFKKGITNGR
jgi:phage gpG-like protein